MGFVEALKVLGFLGNESVRLPTNPALIRCVWWAGERDLAVNTRLMSGDDLRGCLREKREREKRKEKRKFSAAIP